MNGRDVLAVDGGFAGFLIDLVVEFANPCLQCISVSTVRRLLFHVGNHVFGALVAWIETSESLKEQSHFVLFFPRCNFRIFSRHGVEKRPRTFAEFFQCWWTTNKFFLCESCQMQEAPCYADCNANVEHVCLLSERTSRIEQQ